jgi:hypothetical protein
MQQTGMILMEEITTNNVLAYFKNISETLIESLGTKQFHKSSYTIPEGLLNERCGELVKT